MAIGGRSHKLMARTRGYLARQRTRRNVRDCVVDLNRRYPVGSAASLLATNRPKGQVKPYTGFNGEWLVQHWRC